MKAFENIVGKGENAGDRHFLLFPQSFLSGQREIVISVFLFVICTHFGHFLTLLLFGKGLTF